MAFGYVIAQISVTNSEIYAEYIKFVLPTIEQYGGEFLVRGGKSVSYEGGPPGDRNVFISFPSYQAAMICTTQKNTQKLKPFADLLQPVFKPL